ncbi:amidase domain-containing protein [Mycobacterium sp.]|uniref:amidase domain-containing protein n=1 Tax=Mycobacterium sp. TaxID=1785 RepID=UPI002CA60019|nr:amidase domain-containing protein [Mycobacterium sp.]HKP42116.1 amidase domain-containing protein [Mycobacterium sp.]
MTTKQLVARPLAIVFAFVTAFALLVLHPSASATAGGFNRGATQQWALANVNAPERFSGNDCAWFISQALWAGGLPKTADWTDSSLDINKRASKADVLGGPTKTAAQPDYLKNYLVDSGTATIQELNWRQNDVPNAQIGDLIGYDWNGRPDGTLDHMMIVTGFSGQYPLVSGHTRATANQGWTWSQVKNDWIEHAYATSAGDAPRVYLLHIVK